MSKLSSQPLSPLDGRYRSQVGDLGLYLSEAGLNRARIHVEIEWLIWLVEKDLLSSGAALSEKELSALRATYEDLSDSDIKALGEIEATTRHDVKAVEYFIRNKLEAMGREDLNELVHFACTSEDINNLAYALTIRDALEEVWLPALRVLLEKLRGLSQETADTPMLSRT
ncbi:MAG: lyase family protein, partial [Aquiluna sp.]